MLGAGAHVKGRHEALLLADIGTDTFPEGAEAIGVEGAIHRAPVNICLAAGFPHNEAIRWGAAGTRPGSDHQGTGIRKATFAALHRKLDQFGLCQIMVHHRVCGVRIHCHRRPHADSPAKPRGTIRTGMVTRRGRSLRLPAEGVEYARGSRLLARALGVVG